MLGRYSVNLCPMRSPRGSHLASWAPCFSAGPRGGVPEGGPWDRGRGVRSQLEAAGAEKGGERFGRVCEMTGAGQLFALPPAAGFARSWVRPGWHGQHPFISV